MEIATHGPESHQREEAPARLQVDLRFVPHLPLVRLVGPLADHDVEIVHDALCVAAGRVGGEGLVLLDMRGIVACEGAVATRLAAMVAGCRAAGVDVRLQGAPPPVRELLAVTERGR